MYGKYGICPYHKKMVSLYLRIVTGSVSVKIYLFLLSQHGITIQSGAGFVDDPSSEQVSVKTAEMHDIVDKDMMTCEKNKTRI